MIDWQPLIVAGAVLITAIAAAVPGLIVGMSTRSKVEKVREQTDGHLSRQADRVAALEKEVAMLRGEAARGHRRAGDT